MSKKMKIPFTFFKNKSESGNKQPWQWPSCKHPKTLSFRATTNDDDHIFKTVNSVFLDTISDGLETPDSSSDCAATSSTFSAHDYSDNNSSSVLETIIRGVRLSDSERLFFEPGHTSSSIVKEELVGDIKELETNSDEERESSVAVVAVESDDPYLDFKKSMAEMVESHGLMKDWDRLEELLGWYLRMNAKNNHGFIVAAFLDLMARDDHDHDGRHNDSSVSSVAVCCSDSTASYYSSADSCFSSDASSPLSPTSGGIGVVEERHVISQSY
ncbi:transcription repressor ofp13 [Phtheirospermum japonicum]|uniref:Transcription repressor n=1 Tax=Phtheirospermum japonicum TaxID=374723 RepID=A0A830B4E4_9LAMI|nr:transcription repressor ofp13 [Phtheirospermum japonicum]